MARGLLHKSCSLLDQAINNTVISSLWENFATAHATPALIVTTSLVISHGARDVFIMETKLYNQVLRTQERERKTHLLLVISSWIACYRNTDQKTSLQKYHITWQKVKLQLCHYARPITVQYFPRFPLVTSNLWNIPLSSLNRDDKADRGTIWTTRQVSFYCYSTIAFCGWIWELVEKRMKPGLLEIKKRV